MTILRGRVFLANVGVNAAHAPSGLESRLREDGSFTLVTIPESDRALRDASVRRYRDLPEVAPLVPKRCLDWPVHHDPEFETNTFGDNCGWAPRAAALRSCRRGDWIFFIARLVGDDGPLFALVAGLEIESILADVRGLPAPEDLRRFGSNAHIRRALADEKYWDGFWVFAGTGRSGMLPQAVRIGRPEAELLFRDRTGGGWNWRPGRTDLQTIGSYTRSCRMILDPAVDLDRAQAFWGLVGPAVPRSVAAPTLSP